MIRIASPPRPDDAAWHGVFLGLAPAIETYARVAFRHLEPEARGEAIQGVLCYACCVISRLAELGKLDLCYASVLARYGVAKVREGRQVGGRCNSRDVASPYCQWRHGVEIGRLDCFDRQAQSWREVLVEDRKAGPAEVAATRIDFGQWLEMLPSGDRQIAEALGAGHTTAEVAERFGISASRASQLRREFARSWCRFQSTAEGTAAAVCRRGAGRERAAVAGRPESPAEPSASISGPHHVRQPRRSWASSPRQAPTPVTILPF